MAEIIEKAKTKAPIGTIKDFGGRDYIQTAEGWKYHGKGGGSMAQQHSKSSGGASKLVDTHASKGLTPDEVANKLGTSEAVATSVKTDINERFQAFSRFTKAVISKKFKAMFAYGSGGVGKTYTVTKQLELAGKVGYNEDDIEIDDEGDETAEYDYDYVKITGKATPTAVYQALYEHNGKIILFDDCDSVLEHDDAINLFKGALDTSGDGTISYGSAKAVKGSNGEDLPKRFKFNGQVIFISNLPAHKVPQPLWSRSLSVDLTMDKKQTMERIRFIATKPGTKELTNLRFPGVKYTHKDMQEVISFVDKHKDNLNDISVRTIGAMLAIKQMADEEGVPWESDAEHMVFSKSESASTDFFDGGVRKVRALQIQQVLGAPLHTPKNLAVRWENFQKSIQSSSLELVDDTTDYENADEVVEELQKAWDILEEDNALIKGGEGSKGGTVIGHTKSGKPIYKIDRDPNKSSHNPATHKLHSKFTPEDHDDAHEVHLKIAKELHEKDPKGYSHYSHMFAGMAHEQKASYKRAGKGAIR